ncbi:MAG: family 78 glycoside hydrolase catalytic domain [Clostridia bacterium]|nr:family 78 glycoside hydrolase catalytic domain [Clostridia bacterium]
MKFSNRFIRANDRLCDFNAFEPAPYFRKSFTLDFSPAEAQITICGLGFYELSVNGTPITKGALAPYISNPDDLLYYDCYDLTPHLKKGKNVIGILLGNGFRNCYGGYVWHFDEAPCRGPVCVALTLEAQGDGKRFCMEADESFRTHPSPILYNDLRMGYCYDSTQAVDGWDSVDFDDSDWAFAEPQKAPLGTPRLCTAEPIRATEELTPVSVTHQDSVCFYHKKYEPSKPEEYTRRNNVYLYDFGKNTAGVTRLKINGKPGQRITVRHGEELVNGELHLNNILCYAKDDEHNRYGFDYNQADVFICRGGEEEFLPRFKYDGFRYALVEGLEPDQATPELLTAVVMNSDLTVRAGFACSDPTLNQLQKMILNSDLCNFYYFPTDCPQREKNGWTGDAAVSAEQMLLNLGAEASLREWLFNVRAAQNEQGALPGIVPTGGWGFRWGNGPAWDNVCVELPWCIYKYTGDRTVISENADTILRYLSYIFTRRDEHGLIHVGLGDWVDPYIEQNGRITSPLEVTDTLTVYNMMKKAAFLMDEIERTSDAEQLRAMAEILRNDFRRELIDSDMTVAGNCQTSQAFALASGVFEEHERPAAEAKLLALIHEKNDTNACGMIGLRHIFHVLSDMGESELALKIITNRHRTCYGYWVANGADSMWERFQEVGDPKMTSMNHHFLGDITTWFIGELAGLFYNPGADDVTYFEVIPHPVLGGEKPFAKAHFDSKFGRVEVSWEKQDDCISLVVRIPRGLHATVKAADGRRFADGTNEIYLAKQENDRTLTFTII